ncbi:MAG: hypothetical protein WC455_22675 [Dehalococcoidia bacterium]|jgi:predicted phage terminase large subunit-like protein
MVNEQQERIEFSRYSVKHFMTQYLTHRMKMPDDHATRAGEYVDLGEYGTKLCGELGAALKPGGRLGGLVARGHGKTTIATVALVLYCLAHKLKKNIILIAKNEGEAKEKMREIVSDLEFNYMLREDFPHLKPRKDRAGRDVKYSDLQIILHSGVSVRAYPFCGAIRGAIVHGVRPDLIVLDDPEDDTKVLSETEREKGWDWFKKAVINTIPPGSGSVIWLGTLLHYDALLGRIVQQKMLKGWRTFELPCWDTDDHSKLLWPERYSQAELEQRKDEIGDAAFGQEYEHTPVDPASRLWRPEWWRFYDRQDLIVRSGRYYMPDPAHPWDTEKALPLVTYVGVDPSVGEKAHNDPCGFVVLGVQECTQLIYILHIEAARMTFQQQLGMLSRLQETWKPERIGVEAAVYQTVLAQVGWQGGLPVIPIRPVHDKRMRAQGSTIPFEQGRVYLPQGEDATAKFQRECETFPRGRHDDLIDALGLALEVAQWSSGWVYTPGRKRESYSVLEGYFNGIH